MRTRSTLTTSQPIRSPHDNHVRPKRSKTTSSIPQKKTSSRQVSPTSHKQKKPTLGRKTAAKPPDSPSPPPRSPSPLSSAPPTPTPPPPSQMPKRRKRVVTSPTPSSPTPAEEEEEGDTSSSSESSRASDSTYCPRAKTITRKVKAQRVATSKPTTEALFLSGVSDDEEEDANRGLKHLIKYQGRRARDSNNGIVEDVSQSTIARAEQGSKKRKSRATSALRQVSTEAVHSDAEDHDEDIEEETKAKKVKRSHTLPIAPIANEARRVDPRVADAMRAGIRTFCAHLAENVFPDSSKEVDTSVKLASDQATQTEKETVPDAQAEVDPPLTEKRFLVLWREWQEDLAKLLETRASTFASVANQTRTLPALVQAPVNIPLQTQVGPTSGPGLQSNTAPLGAPTGPRGGARRPAPILASNITPQPAAQTAKRAPRQTTPRQRAATLRSAQTTSLPPKPVFIPSEPLNLDTPSGSALQAADAASSKATTQSEAPKTSVPIFTKPKPAAAGQSHQPTNPTPLRASHTLAGGVGSTARSNSAAAAAVIPPLAASSASPASAEDPNWHPETEQSMERHREALEVFSSATSQPIENSDPEQIRLIRAANEVLARQRQLQNRDQNQSTLPWPVLSSSGSSSNPPYTPPPFPGPLRINGGPNMDLTRSLLSKLAWIPSPPPEASISASASSTPLPRQESNREVTHRIQQFALSRIRSSQEPRKRFALHPLSDSEPEDLQSESIDQ